MKARATTQLTKVSAYPLFRVCVLATLTLVLLTLVCTSTAWATTFTVTNTNDSGTGSLRSAIQAATAKAGSDQIVFADGVSGTITLASILPQITDTAGLVINGGGDVTVSGNHAVGVFDVSGVSFGEAKLTLRNLTIADGAGAVNPNFGTFGGGIYNDGTLEVANVTFSGNSAKYGGAIYTTAFAKTTVTNSTFSGNSAETGGGIYNDIFPDETTTVTNSTFSNNSAATGGGIYNGGQLELTNSTFSGNSGFGIYHYDVIPRDETTVTNSTFSGNSGGIYNRDGGMTLRNTILVNSLSGGNCAGEFGFIFRIRDGGYNIDSGATCGFVQVNGGSLSNTNPLLDPAGLQDNGGLTQTIALQPDSPAVDLVGQGTCPPPTTDQRGVGRPQEEACDAGAFELVQQSTPPDSDGDGVADTEDNCPEVANPDQADTNLDGVADACEEKTIDTEAPMVISTVPTANATEVAPTANVKATFSEDMDRNTINGTTFQLFKKGTTTQIPATVSYNAATGTAKLDPTKNLSRGVAYKAVVTTWVKDVAGNRLDQDVYTSGFQQMRWLFRVDD
jgi:predicted outer membrane repeat protein